MTTLRSKLFWTSWKLQRLQNKTKHVLTFTIQRGPGVVIFSSTMQLICDSSPLCVNSVHNLLWRHLSDGVSGYLYHLTAAVHAFPPLRGGGSHQTWTLFEALVCVCSFTVHDTLWLWWGVVEDVQGGTTSVLQIKATNDRVGVRKHMGWSGRDHHNRTTVLLGMTSLLFPFKVDQFKRDFKIRKNQVKKNTAKGYSIYIQGFSSRQVYLYRKQMKFRNCLFVHTTVFNFTMLCHRSVTDTRAEWVLPNQKWVLFWRALSSVAAAWKLRSLPGGAIAPKKTNPWHATRQWEVSSRRGMNRQDTAQAFPPLVFLLGR